MFPQGAKSRLPLRIRSTRCSEEDCIANGSLNCVVSGRSPEPKTSGERFSALKLIMYYDFKLRSQRFRDSIVSRRHSSAASHGALGDWLP